MKSLSWLTLSSVLLSALVWYAYYLLFPDYPLRAKETLVIVFFCTLAVFLVKWLWKFICPPKEQQ